MWHLGWRILVLSAVFTADIILLIGLIRAEFWGSPAQGRSTPTSPPAWKPWVRPRVSSRLVCNALPSAGEIRSRSSRHQPDSARRS